MKLIIQIPCLNETETLPQTLAALPRTVDGVDEIEVLIIDDGSTDGTAALAAELGVHHIVHFPQNRGLAAAFTAGIDAALRLGADIVVNTDADNQYRADYIPALVRPILERRADMVIGDRQTEQIEHFSPLKKVLQRWGSGVVRTLSATQVADSPSGFRAISRKAALRLFVHNRFTYTLETVIQAGRSGLTIANVQVETNGKTRESRLFRSIPDYLRRAGSVMVRSYAMYQPVQILMRLALVFFLLGAITWLRFIYYYIVTGGVSGYIQSLVIGTGLMTLAFMMGLVGMLAELLASNRRLLEEVMVRVRRLDAELVRQHGGPPPIDGVTSTGAPPWGSTRASASAPPAPAEPN